MAFSAIFCLFLRSDLTVQDRIFEIRSLASLGTGRCLSKTESVGWGGLLPSSKWKVAKLSWSVNNCKLSGHLASPPWSSFPVSFCRQARKTPERRRGIWILNSTWNDNSHETKTLECSNSTSWGLKAVTAVKIQKIPRVHKIFCLHSGAGNGCANFMGAWKDALFLQEKPCP